MLWLLHSCCIIALPSHHHVLVPTYVFYISIHVISIDLLCKVKKLNFQIQFLQEIHMDDYCRHFKVKWLSKCQYLVVQT